MMIVFLYGRIWTQSPLSGVIRKPIWWRINLLEPRIVLSLKESCIWVDEPPHFIIETLVNDVTMFDNQ
jgi:hypothetical protein